MAAGQTGRKGLNRVNVSYVKRDTRDTLRGESLERAFPVPFRSLKAIFA